MVDLFLLQRICYSCNFFHAHHWSGNLTLSKSVSKRKRVFCAMILLKNNLREHSVQTIGNCWYSSLDSNINMVKNSGHELETTEY